MGKYWLLDRHGVDGPTVLVEADGSMHIFDVLRFGPGVTSLEDQQQIWDDVAGRIVPTLKPFETAAKVAEEGIEVHADLQHGDAAGANRRRNSSGSQGPGAARSGGGPKRTGGRGRG